MPQPTQTDVHVDQVLTQISVAYIQDQSHFIASQVFPDVPVEKQTDKYFTYTKADWFRDEAALRADNTESVGSGYGLGTTTYSADVYAIHKDIGDQTRKNTDAPLDPDRDATEWVTQRLLLRREKQWVSDYFAASIWGTDVTPANLWSSYTTSDPIGDTETGKAAILSTTGMLPNTFVLSYDVFRQIRNHPDIVDRIKYSAGPGNPAVVTMQALAQVFGVERVLVAMAISNTAVEGETSSFSFTHGKHALLCYVNPRPSLLAPSAGYTFTWRGISEGMGANVGIKRFRMENLACDRVEGQIAWDNKVVASDLGYFFASVVA